MTHPTPSWTGYLMSDELRRSALLDTRKPLPRGGQRGILRKLAPEHDLTRTGGALAAAFHGGGLAWFTDAAGNYVPGQAWALGPHRDSLWVVAERTGRAVLVHVAADGKYTEWEN